MEKSESICDLIIAVNKVMSEVKGIDKGITVGIGNNSYKGVSDQDVKKEIGKAMEKHGLAIFPVAIEDESTISEWDEADGRGGSRHRQQVFTRVKTTYLLSHSSGQYITVVGYGHGVDSQDKSAGKATTYALKYVLLYTFLVPTGKIDDAETTHSESIPVSKPKLSDALLEKIITRALAGEDVYEKMISNYAVTTEQINKYNSSLKSN